MMKAIQSLSRRGVLRCLLAGILCGVLGVTAQAGGTGDEVVSLPLTQDVSGITFIGSVREIRGMLQEVQGRGAVSVTRAAPGLIAVTFSGDYRFELDRARFATSNVMAFFRGGSPFQGGFARLVIGNGSPQFFDPERVPLPLVRLAEMPRLTGDLVHLSIFGRNREHADVDASYTLDRVTIVQRVF